ncbi:MAG: hypothetical protein U0821_00850 [Chloroflexota bacterium]
MAERRVSPDGRFEVRVDTWEVRNSQWVDTPRLVDTSADVDILTFADERWSLDAAVWLDEARVELRLRKFPGGHVPAEVTVTVDCLRGVGRLDDGAEVALGALEAAMEARLDWSARRRLEEGLRDED